MSILAGMTLLKAVELVNDASLVMQVLPPLIEQARALGLGDQDEITKEQLEARAASTGANIDDLRALLARLEPQP